MPAKYLHALGEERRPELHRQIGCVTGILQAFDRRYPIAAHHHKRLLPPGLIFSSLLPTAPAFLLVNSIEIRLSMCLHFHAISLLDALFTISQRFHAI
jgi:hypothetical protein